MLNYATNMAQKHALLDGEGGMLDSVKMSDSGLDDW